MVSSRRRRDSEDNDMEEAQPSNHGSDVEAGSDEEYEIEAILDAKHGAFEEVSSVLSG